MPRRGVAIIGTVLFTAAIAVVLCALTWWLSDVLAQTAIVERAATCRETECFCEHAASGFPTQLMNSLSSFAFVALGVAAVLMVRPASGTRERALTPYFAATMVFIGASSFFYHSTLSFVGQFLDIFSMYTFGLLLIAGALYRSGHLRARNAVAAVVVASIALGVLQYLYPDSRRVLFALVLLPGIVLELTRFVTGQRLRSRRMWAIYLGLTLLVVAYLIWTLDQTTAFCAPVSLVQGHAIWHTLGAMGAFLVVVHHRLTAHSSSDPVSGPTVARPAAASRS